MICRFSPRAEPEAEKKQAGAKNVGGRPARAGAPTKNYAVRLTEAEHTRLLRRAEAAGKSFSDFVRDELLTPSETC